jgi:hypothetical protein
MMSAEKTSWPLHIVPLNDFREHDVDMHCWCNPTLDDGAEYDVEKVYIHHSLDGREQFEEGKRQPS